MLALNRGKRGGGTDAWYSIGIRLGKRGVIQDVRWNGPADKAKLSPGQTIYAINGIVYSGDVLKAAIREAKGKAEPIHLILQTNNFVSLADLDYHDGEKYPVMVRVDGAPDYLDEITKPLTTPPAGSQPAPIIDAPMIPTGE